MPVGGNVWAVPWRRKEDPVHSLAMTLGATILAAVIALAVVEAARLVVRRLGRRAQLVADFAKRSHSALRLTAILLAVELTLARMTQGAANEPWRQTLLHVLLLALICSTAWLLATIPVAFEDVALARLPADVPDNRRIRRMRTQIILLRRVAVAAICVVALGALLMTFPGVRAVGRSLLVSAGVIGAIAAIAAQSVLGNVLAGVQLVLSDAVRLDDVVVVEGEWGRVETLTLSHVVVQIWDERRLILPTSYFTTKPFQNWTRTHAALLGTIEFDVDWSVPFQAARDELRRLANATPLWDRRVCVLQVTEAVRGMIRLRALVSASDAGNLWDLRCLLREQLVVWLRSYRPEALPRVRADLLGDGPILHVRPGEGREDDAAWAHARARGRDANRTRVFGGSVDGDLRRITFIGGEGPVGSRE